MLNILKNTINRVFASGVDSDASAFITATGLSGTTQKSAITTLVKDLKSSGLWSKMKAVYPMVTDNYNLISYSEDLTNGYWSKNNLTITANAINSPFGNLTADKISEAATTGAHYMGSSAGVLTSTNTYTASSYFKAAERNWVYLYLYNGTSALGAYFNISTGVVGTVSGGVTASIIDAGNGWYRCSVSASVTGTGSSNAGITMAIADNNQSYTGVAGNGIYQFGFQLEQSSTASTYQPIATTPSAFMASQMKYNLKDARDLDAAFRLTWSGGWTYSATGATPNGTNAYADTKFIPNNNGLSVNNNSISYYSRTSAANGATQYYEIGSSEVFGVTDMYSLFTRRSTDLAGYDSGDFTKNRASFTNTNGSGFYIGKVNSDLTSKFYKNGILSATKSITNQAVLSSFSVFLGGFNEANTVVYYSPKQVAFAHIGTGLSDNDAMLLNQIVEKYQVALSRGVQAAQSFYYNSAYSNEANTYLYSTQITGTTQVSAINTLINGLKANNLWSKMKAVYPFVTDYRNLLGYTEDFTNGYWLSANATTTSNSTTSPTGTNNADTLTETSATGAHGLSSDVISFTSGVSYSFSIYAKNTASGRGFIQLAAYQITASNQNAYCNFDLINGVVGGSGNATGQIQDVGNGWYRCTMVVTSGKTYSERYNVFLVDNINATSLQSYAGNATKGIYIWGSQLEIGTSASTYQPVLATNNYSSNVAAQMKFNLVNPQDSDAAFRLTFSGGWTYSTNGAQPNGTNGYADTKFNLSSNFSTREQSYSLYTQASNSNANVLAGVTDGSSPTQFYNGTGQFNILSTLYAKGSSFSNGCILMTSTLSAISAFEKAIKIGTTSGSTYSAVNYNYYIGARNNAGTSDFFADRRYSFAHIGNTLTDAEAILFSQLIQQFQTDLSRQV